MRVHRCCLTRRRETVIISASLLSASQRQQLAAFDLLVHPRPDKRCVVQKTSDVRRASHAQAQKHRLQMRQAGTLQELLSRGGGEEGNRMRRFSNVTTFREWEETKWTEPNGGGSAGVVVP